MLVADPKHTKVNVKAELNRSGNELAGRVSEASTRPRLIDLPIGVSSTTINQLQVTFVSYLSFDLRLTLAPIYNLPSLDLSFRSKYLENPPASSDPNFVSRNRITFHLG